MENLCLVIKIATLARLEMPASLKSLGGSKPVRAVKDGLLTLTRHGADRTRARLRLAHHNLGPLILEADNKAKDEEVLADLARTNSFQGCYIARRLFELGRSQAAQVLLRAVQSEVLRFSPDFAPAYLATIAQLYVDLQITTDQEIERALIVSFENFLPNDTLSPLTGLGGILGVCVRSHASALRTSTSAQ